MKDKGQEIGSLLTAAGLIGGGFWALYLHDKGRKAESAEWLHRLFTAFFVDANGKSFRGLLDFSYHDKLRPLLERVLIDQAVEYSTEEQKTLIDLDTALNYLEFILHLENTERLDRSDREAMFGTWYSQMRESDRAALRLYLRRFGYEALAEDACPDMKRRSKPSHEQIAFYGSLRDESVRTKAGVEKGDLLTVSRFRSPEVL